MGTNLITTKMMVELFLMVLGLTAVALVIVYIQNFFESLGDSILDILTGFGYKNADLISTDKMSGTDFEKWLKVKFEQGGCKVRLTRRTQDRGADLLLTDKNGIKIAVQAKKLQNDKTKVPAKVIGEATRGKNYYDCQKAMIVTNQYFTNQAIEEAEYNDVTLWDRDDLFKYIEGIDKKISKSKVEAAATAGRLLKIPQDIRTAVSSKVAHAPKIPIQLSQPLTSIKQSSKVLTGKNKDGKSYVKFIGSKDEAEAVRLDYQKDGKKPEPLKADRSKGAWFFYLG